MNTFPIDILRIIHYLLEQGNATEAFISLLSLRGKSYLFLLFSFFVCVLKGNCKKKSLK